MTVNLSPKLDLVIWSLLITGDEPMMSKLKPKITPKERQTLMDAGLIGLEKRGRASHIVLEDKAWDWAASRLQSPDFTVRFPPQATTAIPTFQVLLEKVGQFLRSQHLSLAEFLQPALPPASLAAAGADPGATPDRPDRLVQQIRQAYASLSQDQPGFAVRLADLRQHVPSATPAAVNQVLLELQQQGSLALLPQEDPEEIGPEDEAAAIDMGEGDKRYFVYIQT